MAYDYTQEKTPIFSGINDNPQSATSSEGSNASDLIAKVNSSLDQLVNDFGNLEGSIASAQTTIGNLDTRVTNNENALSSLQPPSVGTDNFTFDVSNRGNLSDYFRFAGDFWLFIWHLPEGLNFLNYDFNTEEFKPVDGDGNGKFSFSSNINNDLSIQDNVEIPESELSASSFDLTAYVQNKGNGTYIFIPYELVSAGSGGNTIELPNEDSSIILAPQNTLVGMEVVTLIPNSFVAYRDTTASGSDYTPINGIQALRVTDNDNFQGTLQLQSS